MAKYETFSTEQLQNAKTRTADAEGGRSMAGKACNNDDELTTVMIFYSVFTLFESQLKSTVTQIVRQRLKHDVLAIAYLQTSRRIIRTL